MHLSPLHGRQCSLSWMYWHPQRHRHAHHDCLRVYFCLPPSTPNWPLVAPLPLQEYSSNWVGSWSHGLWSHSTTPFAPLPSLPLGNQRKKHQVKPESRTSSKRAVFAPHCAGIHWWHHRAEDATSPHTNFHMNSLYTSSSSLLNLAAHFMSLFMQHTDMESYDW